ncbi:MAG TPA: hypothetical protein VF175_09175 [Lacipirellula sp.]
MIRRISYVRLTAMIAAAAMFGGSAVQSHAQSAAQQSGDWSDPATWAPAEPAAGDLATINGGFTVGVSQAGEVAGTLDLGTVASQSGNLSVSAPATLTVSTTMRVGQAATTTGNVTMSGGTVTVNGASPSGFGNGDLIVGDVGNGNWTQSGGDVTARDEIIIGLADVSTGVVDVSGGTFQTALGPHPATGGRSILVGFDGNGTLNVSGTGAVTANFDLLVGFLPGSVGTVNLSGGNIEAGFLFTNIDGNPAGSTAVINMTGGTFTTRVAFVLGQRAGTTTMNHSGGAINSPTNNGDMVVGDGGANTSTYNVSDTATVDVLHNFIVGAGGGSNGTVNQTGGTITAGDNLLIGRDGVGVWNMDGGVNNARNVFLGDFDSSQGTLKITGGTLNLTGNLSIGGALASNAAPDRVEPNGMNGPQGQALDANGVLIVSGNGGVINVDGNLLANPSDKSSFRSDPFAPGGDNSATLAFEIFSGAGTSLIDVAGVADLDGAVIDLDLMGGFSPALGATFDLLTATSFGSTGAGTTQNVGSGDGFTLASEDAGRFSLAIVSGGNGVILRVTAIPEPAAWSLAAVAFAGPAARRRGCV